MTSGLEAPRYSILIQWSDEDDAFLVSLPEWQDQVIGFIGHGSTYEEALEIGKTAIEQLVSITIEDGLPLPAAHVPSVAA